MNSATQINAPETLELNRRFLKFAFKQYRGATYLGLRKIVAERGVASALESLKPTPAAGNERHVAFHQRLVTEYTA